MSISAERNAEISSSLMLELFVFRLLLGLIVPDGEDRTSNVAISHSTKVCTMMTMSMMVYRQNGVVLMLEFSTPNVC